MMTYATSSTLPGNAMPELDEFMTTEEAAAALGFTVASVHQMLFKKKLESIKVGSARLIPKKAVKEYIERTKGMNKKDPRRSLK